MSPVSIIMKVQVCVYRKFFIKVKAGGGYMAPAKKVAGLVIF